MSLRINIKDDISDSLALTSVSEVIKLGKVSEGEKGKMYYSWITIFDVAGEEIGVTVRQYRKSDCFVVYKYKRN